MLLVSCYIGNIVSILKINAEVFLILVVFCSGLDWQGDCIWIMSAAANVEVNSGALAKSPCRAPVLVSKGSPPAFPTCTMYCVLYSNT